MITELLVGIEIPMILMSGGLGNAILVGNGMYDEKDYVQSHANRPAISPDFAPDYSCPL